MSGWRGSCRTDLHGTNRALLSVTQASRLNRQRSRTTTLEKSYRDGDVKPVPPTPAVVCGYVARERLTVPSPWRRWVRAVWRRPVPAVRTATARALRLPTSTTRRLARVTAV